MLPSSTQGNRCYLPHRHYTHQRPSLLKRGRSKQFKPIAKTQHSDACDPLVNLKARALHTNKPGSCEFCSLLLLDETCNCLYFFLLADSPVLFKQMSAPRPSLQHICRFLIIQILLNQVTMFDLVLKLSKCLKTSTNRLV